MPEWLSKIEQLIQAWKSLQPLDAEKQKKLEKKFRLEFNFNSNHLEGNTLTYGETELLLLFDDTRGGHTMREYEEMKAHDVAWQMVEQWAKEKDRPLTEQAIKNLNEVILVRPFWKEAITSDGQTTRRQINIGNYKQFPNSVRLANGEIFDYASPMETPAMMQELIEWYRTEEGNLHPVTLAALLHYKFVRIHPFDDGNGRLARLLMNYVLLWNDLPPIIIKSADKQTYLRALHIADIGDFEPFIMYIAEQLEWSLRIALKAAKGENVEEEEDWRKKLHLLKSNYDTSKEVTIKKGPEAIQLSLKNIILPFLDQWEADLREFDPLFNSRQCTFRLDNSANVVKASDLRNGVKKCFDDSGHIRLPLKNNTLTVVQINVGFIGLRKSSTQGSFNGGSATISFFENAISIATVTGSSVSKLYSEKLIDEEVKMLTNELGQWFMANLEEFIRQQAAQ